MLSKTILPVLAAVGHAVAQTPVTCTTTATVNSAADATDLASKCDAVKGDVIVSKDAGGIVDMGKLASISGDLSIDSSEAITSIQGSSLGKIGGTFTLNKLQLLSTVSFPNLTEVGNIQWNSLPALGQLSLTKKVTKATNVVISDTFLSTLDGLDFESLSLLDINNNKRLTDFTAKLVHLDDKLSIASNGQNLSVSLPNLEWITEMTILDVQSFSTPSLATVNGSARFDSNFFTEFNAPNLTSTSKGDISFVANSGLTNISFPALTSIGGGLLIANNTALGKVDGFNKVKSVGGAIKLRGNFTEVDFPGLKDVKGAFDCSSTADLQSSCNTLKGLSGKGGGHPIQGTFLCTSNNSTANTDTSSGSSGSSGSGGSDNSGSSGDKNAAVGTQLNIAMLGLAVVGGLAQLL
jgi:hypothetical protein